MTMLHRLRHLRRDEKGTTTVELALGVALFLLLFFMVLDFGRLTYNWVATEKALQIAARMAAVRPPVCADVPATNLKRTGSTARCGTMCNAASNPCAPVTTKSCTAAEASETARAIFDRIDDLLPGHATPANLRFLYSNDRDMNFLGGPYVPVVTVELANNLNRRCERGELCFYFASPLAALSLLAGATETKGTRDQQRWEGTGFPFPAMSVSLPGEDLNLGTNG